MDIYIARGEERNGPYPVDSIRQFLADGELDGAELAWHERLDDWVNVEEIMKGEAPPEEAVEIESADQTDKTALFDLSDPNHKIIESAIREALGKPEGELTKADLDKVTELSLDYNQLTDVTALKDLTQLTSLGLINNQLTDVTPLKDLTQLTDLYLGDNQLTDVTPLKDLTQLTWLSLGYNQLTDVTVLKDLTQLGDLRLSNNQLTDVTALKDLTQLTLLGLSGNQLTEAQIDELKNALPEVIVNV